MRRSKFRPSAGAHGTVMRSTPSAATCGYRLATIAVAASETAPASHASALRAFDGSKAANRLPRKGSRRMESNAMPPFYRRHERRPAQSGRPRAHPGLTHSSGSRMRNAAHAPNHGLFQLGNGEDQQSCTEHLEPLQPRQIGRSENG